ncbi:MAG: type I DNA topoisomerase [Patescibacteria group bacterium]|nr:type I DNA topoisomerase [Patescibacteria group bacterium]
MNLVIVESPAKAKTIEKYLGKGYRVIASYGHVRDLPKSKLGVDIDKNFEPQYIVPKAAQKNVNILKKEAEKAEELYLATDLDREGEAIAWHILELTGIEEEKAKRIRFYEITEEAINSAIKNPENLNYNLVNAQQARRVLDRLVGYNLSPLLWKKIRKGLSAGRVQSVAVKLIVDREREIESFIPKEYWDITIILKKDSEFTAILIKKEGKKVEIKSEKEAKEILKNLEDPVYRVINVQSKEVRKFPPPPFITSTLQQEAARKLGFSVKKTMMIAQNLYEGVELGPEGNVGLITYMRTDSFHLAERAVSDIRNLIKQKFSSSYLPDQKRVYKKVKSAQEAHEAIRPTYLKREPEKMKSFLSDDQLKLYDLIWKRTMACQMKEALFNQVTADIEAKGKTGESFIFRATGRSQTFDGYFKLYKEGNEKKEEELKTLPKLEEKDILKLISITPAQHFTEPPPRYNEASLIKTMEELGIGRPSTYAPTISTIQTRGYVTLLDKKFQPTEIGFIVTDLLAENFPFVVNVDFTAHMEEELDDIAEGKLKWQKLMEEFWEPFKKDLDEKQEKIEKVEIPVKETKELCPKCGAKMVIRTGRYGEFLACSRFPECKTTKPLAKSTGFTCPKCKSGEIIARRTKKGRVFWGCSKYPECDYASWEEPAECPKCKGLAKKKRNKIICEKCG